MRLTEAKSDGRPRVPAVLSNDFFHAFAEQNVIGRYGPSVRSWL
jgi:hypothetical protein